MGKKRKQLSHAEIWDDSALVQSWNDALAEYKLYHSIHARGERVEDIIKDAEAGVQDEDLDEVTRTKGASFAQTDGAMSEKLEDGELEEEPKSTQTYTNKNSKEKVQEISSSHAQPPVQNDTISHGDNLKMPNAVIGAVHDDALRNLLMSWYYAGYYTGLYEGQQKAQNNISK